MEAATNVLDRPTRKRVRTVSTLTDEQVRKKRDNDREAQRAFRERLRSRIQILEEELNVVKRRNDDQTNSLLAEVRSLRSENNTLKAQLRRIHEITTLSDAVEVNSTELNRPNGIMRVDENAAESTARELSMISNEDAVGDGIEDDDTAVNTEEPDPVSSNLQTIPSIHTTPPPLSPPTEQFERQSDPPLAGDLQAQLPPSQLQRERVEVSTASSELTQNSLSGNAQRSEIPQSSPGSSILSAANQDRFSGGECDPYLAMQKPSRAYAQGGTVTGLPRASLYDQHYNHVENSYGNQMTPDSSIEALSYSAATPQTPQTIHSELTPSEIHRTSRIGRYVDGTPAHRGSLPPSITWFPSRAVAHTTDMFESHAPTINKSSPSPVCTILPKHIEATCPLDRILLDFLTSRRVLSDQGTPLITLCGPARFSVSGLTHPQLDVIAHPVSRVMADIVSTFKDTHLREQLGFFYIMHSTMRWQIAPSQETFAHMPQWLHPTVLQVMVPHAAWIDNIPWPQVRDLLIQHPDKYPFVDFSDTYARCARLKWPYDVTDAIMVSDGADEVVLNPLFEKHIRKLECWSVGGAFKERFPELAAATEN